MSEKNLHLPDLAEGARFRVRTRGKYSRRLEGRTGTVVGFAKTKNGVRVLFDGHKYPQTLHRSYLLPLDYTTREESE